MKFVGEHVDQEFGVALCIEVASIVFVELSSQLTGVGEIAIVNEDDSVRSVDEKRLRFLFA